MTRPVALKGHIHVCPKVDSDSRQHLGGPISQTGQSFVTVDGIPVATVSDTALCTGVPTTAAITGGSSIAKIDGKSVARLGDGCEHDGRIVQGVPWLFFE